MRRLIANSKLSNFLKAVSSPYTQVLYRYNDLKRIFNHNRAGNFFVTNIPQWKKRIIIELLYQEGAKSVCFVKNNASVGTVQRLLENQVKPTIVCWGMGGSVALQNYAIDRNLPIWRIEDGFVRSFGLGAHYIPPSSLLLDKTGGIYFNATRPSALEDFLSTHNFTAEERRVASNYIDILIGKNVTKYNLQEVNESYQIEKDKDNIIVFGQCEDDASIKFGSPQIHLNTELIEVAIRENPESNIYFRPHPDVMAGRRKTYSDVYSYADNVTIMDKPYPIWNNINLFSKVYVISSLAGFELCCAVLPLEFWECLFMRGGGLLPTC